jgi:phosphatidylglycerol---prolipoprotein diacylglyceryl transferase
MPTGFNIGPINIHFYGILIMLGVVAATVLALRRAHLYNQDPEQAWEILPWLLIGGIIGARIWHILTPPASMVEQGITTYYYLTHPLDALAIWKGGLGIPGAVIGGGLAVFIYARRHKLSFLTWTDIIAPGLALAQAIGRWGNFVNQELYGAPSNLPWAIFIDPAYRLPGYKDVAYYQPLFLYESIYDLLIMGALLITEKRYGKRLKTGYLFQFYLILYPVGRFLLEFLRLDPSNVGGLNINQTLMAVIAISSTAVLIWRMRTPVKPNEIGSNEIVSNEKEGSENPKSSDDIDVENDL